MAKNIKLRVSQYVTDCLRLVIVKDNTVESHKFEVLRTRGAVVQIIQR